MASNAKYDHRAIEPKWQQYWQANRTFRAAGPGEPGFDPAKKKFYVLDMFPYPSGAGLHVGHPEGYTATDIVARFRRMRGQNVLHPMGYDAFGLPAEQYAVQTGTHPALTTRKNIENIRRQIQSLGFSYDWDRELATTDPKYYKWTQWIFLQLYDRWFDHRVGKARPIKELEDAFESGELEPRIDRTAFRHVVGPAEGQKWSEIGEGLRPRIIDSHRLAYLADVPVNWCPELGTVLANEEVIDGKSERGGYPVFRQPMKQWMLKITAYADRLLEDLKPVDWPEPIKEMQRNWIGRSPGAYVDFPIAPPNDLFPQQKLDEFFSRRENSDFLEKPEDDVIRVFTTRPDTLFGATYMVLAPEHPLVERITTPEQKPAVDAFRVEAARKSDLQRTALAKDKTGEFTGAWAINPVNRQRIPIYVADYVMMGYGTGAIMAVPAHDERDWEFAAKKDLRIVPVVKACVQKFCNRIPIHLDGDDINYLHTPGSPEIQFRGAPGGGDWIDFPDEREANEFFFARQYDYGDIVPCPTTADGVSINSCNPKIGFVIAGLPTADAKDRITAQLAGAGIGRKAVNYKLRDWLFSRQRYWGEPFPVVHCEKCGPQPVDEKDLPVVLPDVDEYRPTGRPEPLLARATEWATNVKCPKCGGLATRELNTMPQWAGSCWYYLRYLDPHNDQRACDPAKEKYWLSPGGVDLYVGGAEHAVLHLLYARFWHKVLFDAGLVSTPEPFCKLVNQGMILGEDGQKMSKSRGNVLNPDDIIREYGADSMRLYEMFMGPLEQTKPWSMRGVEGVFRFLQRVWRLIIDDRTGELKVSGKQCATGGLSASADTGGQAARGTQTSDPLERLLHRTIKKVGEDIDAFKFNTAISAMMEFVNEATAATTESPSPRGEGRGEGFTRSQADRLVLILAPFAPHIAEELWQRLGHGPTLAYEPFPTFDPALLVESTVELPIQVNGKLRGKITVPTGADQATVEAAAKAEPNVQAQLAGKTVRKIIVLKDRLVNIVAN